MEKQYMESMEQINMLFLFWHVVLQAGLNK